MKKTLVGLVVSFAVVSCVFASQSVSAVPTPTSRVATHLIAKVDMLKGELAMARRHERWYKHKNHKLLIRIDQLTPDPVAVSSSSGYSGGVLSASQVASYARSAGFPESAISTMVYYASRESGFDPGAINSSSGACGLWQLYPCYGGSAWLDPATNARLAYQKYQASGFSPWGG